MNRAGEFWDWPPTRRRYRTIDVYQSKLVASCNEFSGRPSGWNSPISKKIIGVYWRVTLAIVKMLIVIWLTAVAFAGSWLFWTVITL
jgi:hypothetical protein